MEGLGGATRSGVVGGARTGRGLGEDEASPRARAVETAACASGDPGGVASEGPVRPGLLAFRGN